MERGLAVLEVNDTETTAIFFDQDVVEFARLNAQTKKRLAEAERAQRATADNRRKAEKAQARRKAYNLATAGYVLSRSIIAGGAAWAGAAGMIHPIISLPVVLYCLCTASARLGVWFGKNSKKGAR